jgi:hypothetical protein
LDLRAYQTSVQANAAIAVAPANHATALTYILLFTVIALTNPYLHFASHRAKKA